ncbi:hypothetical protein NFI96_024747 [Prochilodus magdalenae]|nr:hypothetical protein NFI96_024747 [Prochilodus magdalenae]
MNIHYDRVAEDADWLPGRRIPDNRRTEQNCSRLYQASNHSALDHHSADMEEQSLEEVSPAADATLAGNSEEHGDVPETEAGDTVLGSEEPAAPEAVVPADLEAEEMGRSPADEHSDPVPVESLTEAAEPQTAAEEPEEPEEPEELIPLPDQTPGGELPTSERFEEGETPDVDPFIGERLSREGSVRAEEDDEGPVVLEPGTPEPEIQLLQDEAPSDQLQTEEISYEEQLELLQDLQAERDRLSHTNTQLQVKLVDYFRRKMGEDPQPEREKAMSDLQQRYQKYLDVMEDLKWQQVRDVELHQQQAKELERQSQEKLEQVEREWRALLQKYELAVTALTWKLGKQVAQAQVEQLQQEEQKREEALTAVRTENIKLKMKTRKLEAELKAKEELAEGLYLIDFEQLKIENQTYHEKIEERKEELLKLRTKFTSTVQVGLSDCISDWCLSRPAEVDSAVARKRDILTRTKQARDALRADNLRLRQRCGLLGNSTLLRDFEEKVDASESLETRLETLKRRHAELTLKCAGVKKKLENCRTVDH